MRLNITLVVRHNIISLSNCELDLFQIRDLKLRFGPVLSCANVSYLLRASFRESDHCDLVFVVRDNQLQALSCNVINSVRYRLDLFSWSYNWNCILKQNFDLTHTVSICVIFFWLFVPIVFKRTNSIGTT